MTMFKDCYETTVGQVINTKPIELAIKETLIKDGVVFNYNIRDVGSIKPMLITGNAQSETQIPLFAHPITITGSEAQRFMCADIRFFVRKDTPIDIIEKSIKNRVEFNFTVSRLILSMLWEDRQRERVRNSFQFATVVFGAWLSETISKNFVLDYRDQTVLNIITQFYYMSLFVEGDIDSDMKDRMAAQIIKLTKAPAEMVLKTLDATPIMGNITEYCQVVSTVLENTRLKNFNLAVLLTLVKNSWYGTNGKEIISVALEHPPTWIAVIWAALNERSFSSSLIARLAERFGKRGASDEFNKNYRMLMQEYLA